MIRLSEGVCINILLGRTFQDANEREERLLLDKYNDVPRVIRPNMVDIKITLNKKI